MCCEKVEIAKGTVPQAASLAPLFMLNKSELEVLLFCVVYMESHTRDLLPKKLPYLAQHQKIDK